MPGRTERSAGGEGAAEGRERLRKATTLAPACETPLKQAAAEDASIGHGPAGLRDGLRNRRRERRKNGGRS